MCGQGTEEEKRWNRGEVQGERKTAHGDCGEQTDTDRCGAVIVGDAGQVAEGHCQGTDKNISVPWETE